MDGKLYLKNHSNKRIFQPTPVRELEHADVTRHPSNFNMQSFSSPEMNQTILKWNKMRWTTVIAHYIPCQLGLLTTLCSGHVSPLFTLGLNQPKLC